MSTEEKVKDLWDKWYSGEIPYTEYHKQIMSIIEEEKRIAWANGVKDMYRRTVKKLNEIEQTKDAR